MLRRVEQEKPGGFASGRQRQVGGAARRRGLFLRRQHAVSSIAIIDTKSFCSSWRHPSWFLASGDRLWSPLLAGSYCSGRLISRVIARYGDSVRRVALAALPKKAMIFQESQCSNQVFLINQGWVKLFSTSREGRRMIIRIAGPGDILGLNAALNDLPYEVTAQTLEPAQVIGVPRPELLWLLETFPEVARKAAQVLANQYRELFLDTRRLALCSSASGRLARLLLDWSATAARGKVPRRFTRVYP